VKYLITGITGFVGPHLADLLLEEGHNVFGLIRCPNGREKDLLDVLHPEKLERIEWRYADLTDFNSLHKVFLEDSFDGVFHLAAQSHVPKSFARPVLTFDINIMGSANLLSCVEETQTNCHVHICSSSEVYGNQCKEGDSLAENSPLQPINPYAVSKTAVDLYMQERMRNGHIAGFITRAFSHTGPSRGYNFSISSDAFQIAKMKVGLQDKILLIGNLETKRVVMDVRDCVRAYYLLMKERQTGVFNVCGNTIHAMQYFTDCLIEASGLKGIVQEVHPPFYRPVDIDVQQGDSTKIQQAVGWEVTIPIEQTLKDLLRYWEYKLR